MELVIEKEIFKEYLDLLSPKSKDEKALDLIVAIESQENRIKISSEYIEIIEDYIRHNKPEYIDYFQKFITSLNDSSRIISFKSSKETTNELVLLEDIFEYQNKDYTFILAKRNMNVKNNQYINCVYDNVNKPNKDWFLLSMFTTRLVSVSSPDFNNPSELTTIFEVCRNIPRENKDLHIIDSYFSLHTTSIQKLFKGNGFKFKCYTTSFLKKEPEKSIIRNNIKQEFGRRTQVKFSSDKRILHERKIINGLLVIDLTHDFSEITLPNNNWTAYFSINLRVADNNSMKFDRYN